MSSSILQAISPSGKELAYLHPFEDSIDIWDLERNRLSKSLNAIDHHCSFGWNPQGDRFLTVESNDGYLQLKVWDPATGRQLLVHTQRGSRLLEGNTLKFPERPGKLYGWMRGGNAPMVWDGTPTAQE